MILCFCERHSLAYTKANAWFYKPMQGCGKKMVGQVASMEDTYGGLAVGCYNSAGDGNKRL